LGWSQEDIAEATKKWYEANGVASSSINDLGKKIDNISGPMASARDYLERLKGRADDAADSTDDLTDSWSDLQDELTDQNAWLDVLDSLDAYFVKMNDATASDRDKQRATNDMKLTLLEYKETLGEIPAKTETLILAAIDKGAFDYAAQQLDALTRSRQASINPVVVGTGSGGNMRAFAAGTNSAPAGLALVGENGPEIVNFRGGESVTPNHKLGGSTVVNITTGADPRQVIEIIKRYTQRGGNL
jgi:phage-related tail protein